MNNLLALSGRDDVSQKKPARHIVIISLQKKRGEEPESLVFQGRRFTGGKSVYLHQIFRMEDCRFSRRF
jgi:hypothetical protein